MARRQAPYDDFVMDHIRNARNYRVLDRASHASKGSNPMCGDVLTVQLHVMRGRIEEAAFQCECCGVSMASASMMTDWLMGRELAEARQFARAFAARLAGRSTAAPRRPGPMERALLATVRDFPARTRCAVLPWTTLEAALDRSERTNDADAGLTG